MWWLLNIPSPCAIFASWTLSHSVGRRLLARSTVFIFAMPLLHGGTPSYGRQPTFSSSMNSQDPILPLLAVLCGQILDPTSLPRFSDRHYRGVFFGDFVMLLHGLHHLIHCDTRR
jgi:hypothetical protein